MRSPALGAEGSSSRNSSFADPAMEPRGIAVAPPAALKKPRRDIRAPIVPPSQKLMLLANGLTSQMHPPASSYRIYEGRGNKRLSDYVGLQLFRRHHSAHVLPLSFQPEYTGHHFRH